MKKWLILFGILDIITLARSMTIKMGFVGISTQSFLITMTILKWILYLSLATSAYFLLRKNKTGIWISYVQFPFRLMFMTLSFGFILSITDFFGGMEWMVDWRFRGARSLITVLS